MKILAVGSYLIKDPNKQSQVDWWRIGRPIRELKKHVDWQIDEQTTYIHGFEKYNSLEEFTNEELEKALKKLGEYDIVFSSYHADIAGYLLLKMANMKYGTQFVLDCDDDMFAINEDNPFWAKMDDEKTWRMQVMIRENDWICTTNEYLAERFRERRRRDPDNHPDESVFVNPNSISDVYPECDFQNKDIMIGYFGGSSHLADLHDTGALDAVARIMHENKNVRFKAIGIPVDTYIPRGRYQFVQGLRGTQWTDKLFKTMKLDIALAPLGENIFNRGKSDIKWQESTRAGSAVIATDIEPYQGIPKGAITLVKNTEEDWYKALNKLLDKKTRQTQLKKAREELKKRRLEVNWQQYKQMFERIHNANSQARK